MTGWRGAVVAACLALVAAACGGPVPSAVPVPSSATAPASTPLPPLADRPFQRGGWPEANACETDGYDGLVGRVEAVSERTVRFTLCRSDAAFAARLADPSLGILDAAAIERIALDPARSWPVAGAGAFRIEAWTPGDSVVLARRDTAGAAAGPGRIVLRWDASATARGVALRASEVDGIDDPSPADAADFATLPEVDVLPRPGLATAYLGFGAGRPFGSTAVRRAFAQGLDRAALAREAFPAGSSAASSLAPCEVPAGCAGLPWYDTNGPAGTAALDLAGVDRATPIVLHVPDRPVPGLPDPAAAGEAVRAQLASNLGVSVEVVADPAADLAAEIAGGRLSGLYLWGVASRVADPSGFLEPVVGAAARGPAPGRAKGAADALASAAAGMPAVRERALAQASDAVRSGAAVVPLAHPGSTVAWRSDVAGVAVSPAGVDPLGGVVPGDRGQLVVMSASEPGGAWCGIAPDPASVRLCALVTPGLYGYPAGTLEPAPSLASRCTPSADARTWTCRLRQGLVTDDGLVLDAADVLATFRALGDGGSALRAALPGDRFAWDALFGAPVQAGGAR